MDRVRSSLAAVTLGAFPGAAHEPQPGRRDATGHRARRAPRALAALCLAAAAALLAAAPAGAQEPAAEVLVFHDGSDPVTDAGIAAIEDLGAENDFGVTASQDPAEFDAANLEGYRSVVFLDVEGSPLGAGQLQALQGYVQDGGGFLGVGGTAAGHSGSSFFDGLIGARPDPASPGGTSEQTVAVGDRVHPASADLPLEWNRTDVWYQWESRPTGQVHTLARYHAPDAPAGDGTDVGGTDWPISWCRDFQGGRSFYTGMGRTAESYSDANFQQHLLGAVQWTAGLLRANCKATISSNYEAERVVDGTSGDLANTGESHGLSIAPNGWVIYIGRADCRTNEQRAEVAGLPVPTGRILDFTNPNVGVGCGPVHIFDPAEHEEGVVNSGTTLAGIIPVYGDRGGGNEINGKIEAGLLGVTVAPDFMQTGHIYVQYFPTFNPDNPNHPGLADGADRRRTKMQKARVSRFTIDLATKELDLDSEVVIFEYESQVYSCCHRGGGMGFDSEGNLYVTTGDSNSSQGSSGYSGNNPTAHCPQRNPLPGPGDPANNADCGELNFSYQDARRTAGSTNDFNGKMLRFNPIDSIADGAQPDVGVGTTYTLPDESSPNGPNLFDGTEGAGGLTKPEIYAMGLRNPSRLAIDPETDIPYAAWVGPDAGAPNAQQGPSTYESATQLASAGNYGWPYCMGNGQGYRDRLADGSLRTSNAPGYVSGGPAGAPIPGFYDCENLHNDSPNNTGLTGALPHETGTGMDAGAMRPVNIWYSRGNPGGANGCPEFPRPNGAPDYGASPTQLCPYIVASGATVFTGPVYRHPDNADPAVAWPQYWDGRWFLFDFGNNSAEHGLLLDPETAADGAQPVYADSLRSIANWSGNYMDSKFAPDGSLYVQTYDGFFTTGNNAGLVRITYNGGPDTPGADPQWEATGTPLEVQFDIGASGGVSYEWDFDNDGTPDSTEANPVHTFAESGPQDVTLTVTYVDGGTDSKTITVNPSGEDTTPPMTTIQLDGADPLPTYDGSVEVTLDATDDGSGVELTEYKVDGGAFTEYTEAFTVSGDGEHTVEYRSRDAAGNVEETKSVTFAIETGGGCITRSDEFDGADLDTSRWTTVRNAPGGEPSVVDGSLVLPVAHGDIDGGNTGPITYVAQDAPGGAFEVTTRVAIEHTNEWQHGGLMMWVDDDNYTKFAFTMNPEGNRFIEYWTETDGVRETHVDNINDPGTWPNHMFMRLASDGDAELTASYSTDGESWTELEGTAPLWTDAGTQIGVNAMADEGEGNIDASFDFVRFTPDEDCPGGDSCDEFEGTELDPKWEIVNPSGTNPPTVSDDHLNMPIIPGDLFGGNGTAQMLLQGVPTDESWVLTAKIEHGAIDTNGEAAGLALVNRFDPNHFAKTALQFKNDTDPDTGGDQPGVWAERVLTADSSAVTLPGETVPFPNSGALDFEGDYGWVRFVHDVDAQEIGTWTSTDGEAFVNFGANMPVDEYLSEPGGLRAGVFAKHDGSGDDVVRIDAFNVVIGSADPQTPPDECDSGGGGDVTPPTTTATTDPADPDGENGWFTSPVEVTLDATDNDGGSGVESTEYAIDGGAFQAYSAPFTVEGDGQHEVEFRSTDAEGNVEATKSLDLKIDSTPPETEATVDGNEVTLDADDGPDGSGVALTEFRVDGGEFQPYVEEETILNSAADLGQWAQAGPGGLNWVDEEGGFARTQGGLGMPWYPVREFGDFSLKLQWRDSSEGANGNSGVFVRFPDPRIPLAERPTSGPGDWDGEYCGRTGAAATQPAWVAIFCGQEIQINDHQGDTQKTGSIYNFGPVEDPDHMGQPKGTWVDYEVRVEGQQYTILRNDVVLNEFDNSIPLESSRAGDPPTDARQFDSGYIGLQNHGNADVIDFRNVRVLPLDSGSVQGPIVVEPGEHTVEFRSTDAAGNVEEIKSVTVGGGDETELDVKADPRRKTVKPGNETSLRAMVENTGDAEAGEVEVCARAPERLVKIKGDECQELGSLAPDASETERFTFKPTNKAAGKKVTVTFRATAANAPRATATATLKVKDKK